MTNTTVSRRQISLARFAVSSYFLFGGSSLALWAVHIPLIEARTGISHATLGALLVLGGFGGFAAMQAVGWMIDHIGSKTTTQWGGVTIGIAVITPGWATDPIGLGLAIFALGFGLAAVDVPANTSGLQVEKLHGKPIFSIFHSFWSMGGILGAVAGSITLAMNLPVELTLTVAGSLIVVLSLAFGGLLLANEPNTTTGTKVEGKVSGRANRRVLGFVALAGALAASAAIVEGTANDWSALYFKDTFDSTESAAAWGLAIFSVFMVFGRLVADRVVAATNRLFVIRWGSLVATIATVGIMFSPVAGVGFFFWGLLGLGLSGVVPQIFASAGEVGEASHVGRNMAKVVGITYLAALAGPSIIGLLTIWLPLNLALGYGTLLALFVVLASPKLERMTPA